MKFSLLQEKKRITEMFQICRYFINVVDILLITKLAGILLLHDLVTKLIDIKRQYTVCTEISLSSPNPYVLCQESNEVNECGRNNGRVNLHLLVSLVNTLLFVWANPINLS